MDPVNPPVARRHGANVVTEPRVLLIDDVPDNLGVLRAAFEESGFAVETALDGAAALALTRTCRPDIVLLDVFMPGVDGFAVCRQLRADPRTSHVPVVFMTALTDPYHVRALFDAGATDYICKPVRCSEVLARITALLDNTRGRHQPRNALDAFGNAVIAVTPGDWRIVWQSPLARQWMQRYLGSTDGGHPPAPLAAWLEAASAGPVAPLTAVLGTARLSLSIAARGEQWMLVLREDSDEAQLRALMAVFALEQREAEVLHWVTQGKLNRDIAAMLDLPVEAVQACLEGVFAKLNVESRTAAASLAMRRLRAAQAELGAPA